jgi:predicted AAA+ superfamily ATPase
MIMQKSLLKDIIIDQHEIGLPPHCVERESFSDIKHLKNNPQIIIITGMRRCGKSTLMQIIRQHETLSDYYINFDDDRLVQFQLEDFQALYELFIELYGVQKTFFFDEIQNIPQWERFVRRLHDQGNKIYITGSNATLFSDELGTRLTGRYIPVHLFPYSFCEFISGTQRDLDLKKPMTTIQKGIIKNAFSGFLQLGGIPDYVTYQQKEYLHSLYESILYRDIIVRYKITNQTVIKELAFYLASNMSKEITFNSLRKMLNVASPSTISLYCSYLQKSYLCYFVNRYAHSLRKQMQYAKKVYFNDQALAMNIGFRTSSDHGRVLENIVFLELLRRKYEVFFHKEEKECDFLVRVEKKIQIAIQVCAHLEDKKLKERELAGLTEAMHLYDIPTGLILTEDTESEEELTIGNKTHIVKVLPIWKWLLP